MGICNSKKNKIHPKNYTNNIINKSWDIIKNKNEFILVNFNDTFLSNLNSDNKKKIITYKKQSTIFSLIIKLLIESNYRKKNNILLQLHHELNIINCNNISYYNKIQESLNNTIKEIFAENLTDEILNSWNKTCKNICSVIQSL